LATAKENQQARDKIAQETVKKIDRLIEVVEELVKALSKGSKE